ncbi:MAG: ABC transporter permease, partial [Rhodoferax sp.]
MYTTLWHLLCSFSWQEWRNHPWRNAAAIVSVMLGVALAFSVHLINASALDEFAQAVRSVGGQPDLELRAGSGVAGGVDHALLGRMLHHPDVVVASPVLELSTYALTAGARDDSAEAADRVLLRIVGVDALQVAPLSPDLLPIPSSDANRLDIFAPSTVFLNATARSRLGGNRLQLQRGMQLVPVRVAGSVRASGAPLAVMDIAAAQDLFAMQGRITRVDVRLRAGVDRANFMRSVQAA